MKRICRHVLFLITFYFLSFFFTLGIFFRLLGFSLLRYLFTIFVNTRFRPVIEFSYAI